MPADETVVAPESSASARWIALGLFVLTIAAYAQVGGHQFLNWDDQSYVTDNPHVQRGLTWPGIEWAFTTTATGNWHPLTWLSHMLDCQLFGVSSGAHHQVNATLHALNAVLLFLVLRRMTRATWPAGLTAALFALHPLRVESVAWVAERKDLLAGLFWILALLAYSRYVERRTRGRYAAILVALVLGLMAKPMAVTLPFVLLLLDFWPLRRTRALAPRALWIEKLPMLLVVAAMSAIAFLAQSAGGAVSSIESIPIGARVANALIAYVAYPLTTLWPAELAFFYPHPIFADPGFSLLSTRVLASGLVLAAVTILVTRARTRAPYLPVGWFWYLGTAFPVIGIVQIGTQARADRYTYIPAIGLAIMIAWAASALWQRKPSSRTVLVGSVLVVLVAMTGLTWRGVSIWRDNETLCSHALQVTSGNFVAHTNLGSEYGDRGDYAAAVQQLEAALQANPTFIAALCNLGVARANQGALSEARQHLERALEISPKDVPSLLALGLIELRAGNLPRGAELLERVLDLDPDQLGALYNLGVLALRQRDSATARARFERVLELDPTHAEARAALARVPR